jgi:DNA-binding FrmR family transcriptional regulator
LLSLGYIALSPLGGYPFHMTEPHRQATHPAITARLKRAEGHLRRVVAMIEEGRPCLELATQLHAVERAVAEAKRALIHDHIDHCLTGAPGHDLAEIKSLTKLL